MVFPTSWLLAFVVGVGSAHAIWVNLTPTQIEQAIAQGLASYERARETGRPIDDLDPEYVVDLAPEVGRALLFTEFSTLALEARRWRAIGQQLTAHDIRRILTPISGRIRISVVVIAPHRDPLRHRTVRLVQGSMAVEPVAWDVFRGVPLDETPGMYRASADYTFDARTLDPDAPAALLLRDDAGNELRFEFDLARLR